MFHVSMCCAVQLVHYQETCVHVLCCTTGPLSRELSGELTGPVEGKGKLQYSTAGFHHSNVKIIQANSKAAV